MNPFYYVETVRVRTLLTLSAVFGADRTPLHSAGVLEA